jgi:hypothetical protein
MTGHPSYNVLVLRTGNSARPIMARELDKVSLQAKLDAIGTDVIGTDMGRRI